MRKRGWTIETDGHTASIVLGMIGLFLLTIMFIASLLLKPGCSVIIDEVYVCRFHCDYETGGHGFVYWNMNKSCEPNEELSNRRFYEMYTCNNGQCYDKRSWKEEYK